MVADAGQATRDTAPTPDQLEDDVVVNRRHEARRQRDGLVLRTAAVGELRRALRGIQRTGLSLGSSM